MADMSASPTDQAAVGDVLLKVATAFRTLSADGLEDAYTDDADWTNAFGTTRKGAAEIAAYLRRVFADPHFAAGKPIGPPEVSIRFVDENVAVAKTYLEREGQLTTSGETLPVRRDHSLKVLRREDDGWRIVSDIYMDAREDATIST